MKNIFCFYCLPSANCFLCVIGLIVIFTNNYIEAKSKPRNVFDIVNIIIKLLYNCQWNVRDF